MRKNFFVCLLLLTTTLVFGQYADDSPLSGQPDTNPQVQDDIRLVEKLKYIKQPGLANAASKIYSADRRYSISGFLELNNVNYLGERNLDQVEQDLELGYTGLYRLGVYYGYKISKRWIFNSEVQVELLHDGVRVFDGEVNVELIFDYLWKESISFRFGNFPVPLGYVNVMEEPTAFYTVNRPEVERILIPTQWLETGVMMYGNIRGFEYNTGILKGVDATHFSEGAWIRPGRYHWYEGIGEQSWDPAVFGKIAYHGTTNLEIATAGYYGSASRGHVNPETNQSIQTSVAMATTYIDYNIGNISLFGLGMYGQLNGTEDIAAVHRARLANGSMTDIPVLGHQTYGGYGEIRWDILPLFNEKATQKLPLFFRYERLNTHHKDGYIAEERQSNEEAELNIGETNITNLVFGINYRPKRNIAIKANYTHRINMSLYEAINLQPSRLEIGVGIIF
ncbi:MAG: hypothetical protein JJU02_00640 [Cryomorphaceae bacterium]|nr:hypothetical protein [Cryomorphaceae bacterium]